MGSSDLPLISDCDKLGTPLDKVPQYIHLGQKMGLGKIDFNRLSPVEVLTG